VVEKREGREKCAGWNGGWLLTGRKLRPGVAGVWFACRKEQGEKSKKRSVQEGQLKRPQTRYEMRRVKCGSRSEMSGREHLGL